MNYIIFLTNGQLTSSWTKLCLLSFLLVLLKFGLLLIFYDFSAMIKHSLNLLIFGACLISLSKIVLFRGVSGPNVLEFFVSADYDPEFTIRKYVLNLCWEYQLKRTSTFTDMFRTVFGPKMDQNGHLGPPL